MADQVSIRPTPALFSAEVIEAQGRADREYLTHRVKLVLDMKEKHPSASFADIAAAANDPCGRGCCCCCGAIAFGADLINPGPANRGVSG